MAIFEGKKMNKPGLDLYRDVAQSAIGSAGNHCNVNSGPLTIIDKENLQGPFRLIASPASL
jgi:hypothetical protein